MADELPEIIQRLVGDAGDLFATIDAVEAQLEAFADKEYDATIGVNADLGKLYEGIARAQAFAATTADYFEVHPIEEPVTADLTKLYENIARAQAFAGTTNDYFEVHPIEVPVQANLTDLYAGIARAAAFAGAQDLGAFFGGEATTGAAGGAGGGIFSAIMGAGAAALGGGGGGPGWFANALLWVHAIHLFMPEILGLVDSLAAATLGFTALGIAAAGTVSEISQGVSAVGSATDAIGKAIPGTTQWTSAVARLGQQWSQIPTDVQPAVAAINNLIQNVANSPLGNQVRSWLNAQAITLTQMFSGLGNAFMPLIVAMERAVDTIEQIVQRMIGGGGLQRFVDGLSKMVGPAILLLAQLAQALVRIGVGFAQAIQAGEGMQALVNLFRSIADLVNSSIGQGFIQGWVDFDRLLTDLVGMGLRVIGWISNMSSGMKDLAVAVGFVVSAFAMLKATAAISGWLAGLAGGIGPVTTALYGLSAGVTTLFARLIGPGALLFGLTGLTSELSRLTGVANPLAAMWHGLASAIGLVSDAGNGANSTILKYQGALNGAVYGTKALTDAQDLLVRSEQSIGGNLASLNDGFRMWNLQAATLTNTTGTAALRIAAATNTNDAFAQSINKVTDSVTNLITQLTDKNASLAQWAADAQILIQRGMDPSAVASLAQQAPQDLGSMVNATTDQLRQMNVQWQEQMLLAKMSGQHGIMDFVSALRDGFNKGTPVVHDAAAQLFQQLGTTLNIPFTGTQQSIDQIAAALQTLPISVLQNLAGATHQVTAASQDAAKATQSMANAHQSAAQVALSLAGNIALIAVGLRSSMPLFSLLASGVRTALAAIPELVAGLVSMAGGFDIAAVAGAALDVALGPIGLIAAAVVALGVGIYELVKHFKAVSEFLNGPWGTAISVAVGAIDPLIGAAMLIIGHWRGVWTALGDVGDFFANTLPHAFGDFVNFFTNSIPHALSTVGHFFEELPGKILNAIKDLPHLLNTAAQHAIAYFILGFIYEGIGIWDFWTKVIPKIISLLGDAATALFAKGVDLLKGMWNGIESFFTGPFVTFWTTLLPRVAQWLVSADTWLFTKGIDLLKGMWNGIESFFTGPFVTFWTTLLPRVAIWLVNADTWLFQKGIDLLKGMWNGITGFFSGDFTAFFTSLPKRVEDFFIGADQWLFDIGRKIITGLWDGLKSAFDGVKNWLSGIGNIIKNLKGPPEKDAQILVENGILVMQGFAQGLHRGWQSNVVPMLAGMTTQLGGGIGVGNIGLIGGGVAPIVPSATAGAGQTTIVSQPINFVVNNQVIAQAVLQTLLRQGRATGNILGRYAGGNQTGAATSINPNAIQR